MLDLANVKHILCESMKMNLNHCRDLVPTHVVSHRLHNSELKICHRRRDVGFQSEEDRVALLDPRVLGVGVKHDVGFVILSK